MPKMRLALALLLCSFLQLAQSARVIESQLKAELDKEAVASQSAIKGLNKESEVAKDVMWPFSSSAGKPKICCCAPSKCYWQNKISFDTGSGCNVVGMVNPWAEKKHISGITDQTRPGRSLAEDPAKNLLVFNPNNAAKQDEYGRLCEALDGAMIMLKDVHGKVHQYIVDLEHFANSTAPVVHEDPPPVVPPAPAATQEADKKAMEAVVQEVKVKLTNKILKTAMRSRPPDASLCSLACDMWPPVKMGTGKQAGKYRTQKSGCHSPLSSHFNSNAVNYCKKVCKPENQCK